MGSVHAIAGACLAATVAVISIPFGPAAGDARATYPKWTGADRQGQGDVVGPDLSFSVAIAEPYAVMAFQPDGKIIVARNTRFDSPEVRGSSLARLNRDGTLDETFRPQISGMVWTVTPQNDGDIMVRGTFRRVSGFPITGLARLNSNGTIDTAFRPPNFRWTKQWPIFSLIQLPNGDYLIGERGLMPKRPEASVFRLDPNGNLDKKFRPLEAQPLDGMALQSDGKVLLGNTIGFNGEYPGGMTRIFPNGKRDKSLKFDTNGYYWFSGFSQRGDMFIDGTFEYIGEFKRSGLTKLKPNGRLDPSFSPRVQPGTVFGVIPQPQGQLLISGWFDQVEGRTYPGLARLNPDGSVDANFTSYLGPVDWLKRIGSGEYYALTRDGVLVKAIFF